MPAAVLHLLPTAQPEGTSPARIVASVLAHLDPRKFETHVWFLSGPGPLVQDLESAGAIVRSLNWDNGIRDPIGTLRFLRWIRKSRFQIVHLHRGGRVARYLIRLFSNARLIVHLHTTFAESGPNSDVASAVRCAERIITVSQAHARQIAKLDPVVLYAGIEVPEPYDNHRAARRTIVVGTAARLVNIKAIPDLLHAMALLKPAFPDVELQVAGDGPDRQDLEKQASNLGLSVRFLGWQKDLASVMRNWDIFAMPSLEEGLPMVALEAMAAGLPVVTTNVGGIPELVEEGKTGWLVPPSDPAALSARLQLLIADPERRRAMGTAGRERARKHFSAARTAAQLDKIYTSLLTSR